MRLRPGGPAGAPGRRLAALYVHGFNDYFFQAELARWFDERGVDFHAVDLRKYGRSLRPHQTANMCRDLAEYDEDLDAAARAVLADHDELLLVAHSTGGLIAPLWLARRPALPVAGVVLNSPFLALRQPAAVQAALLPALRLVAGRAPGWALPGGPSLYTESIHAGHRGEWDFDLRWKPIDGPVRVGWVAAVAAGHAAVEAGVGLEVPILSLSSTRTVTARRWTEEVRRGDAVLDAERIARLAPALGRHVTVVRVPDALHDVFLSAPPARRAAYEAVGGWLDAWVPGRPSR